MKKFRLIHQNSNMEAPEGRFDIGRSIDCHLVLDDPSVSRVHATIINQNGKLLLEDRGSRNGCIVNGERAAEMTELRDGDRISIGHQTIRVVALERGFDAERTLGLVACPSCGAWMSSSDETCPHCNAAYKEKENEPEGSKETFQARGASSTIPPEKGPRTQRPQMMIAALIKKAVSMDRYEEAERLLQNLMESAVKREQGGSKVPDTELHEVGSNAVMLATATSNPKHISNLFSFHAARGKLMPRETIELLYNSVRKVGYRSCPEMNKYLALLKKKAGIFTPGEKFIHRRLEGLVGMCS